jgi:hypothetical protein
MEFATPFKFIVSAVTHKFDMSAASQKVAEKLTEDFQREWDIWDYNHTVKVERPILHQNLLAYLDQVKSSLLKNPESGIMAAINQLEVNILKGIQSASDTL